jgi:SAM-dependent methyltransferase
MSEQKRWTDLASKHPYWTVLAEPRYRADKIGPEDVRAFFETGDREVSHTLSTIRETLAPSFQPKSAIDFGCGVGRLTIPIARASQHVVGVDLSEPMLREIARNCEERGLTNVELVRSEDFLNADDQRFSFDFVHSYIVLQHIPPRKGMQITDCLLRRLVPGGVGALHYTFGRRSSLLRRIVHPMRLRFPPLNVLANIIQGKPTFEPMIPMHHYDFGALFELFQRHGCINVHAVLTDQGGHLGAMLMFRKE